MARPRVHDDALAARLLETAAAQIAAGGPDTLTVRAVARDAGTSTSAVYALFGSREALVRAAGDEAFARFAAGLAAAPRTAEPAADLLALGLAYRDYALAEPHFYHVMFGSAGARRDPSPATDLATFQVLETAVARVLGPGAPPDAATEGALALWSLVHGLVSLELAGLLPGEPDVRAARYRAAMQRAGPALLAHPTPGPER